jgi:hypothetical protein
MDFLSGSSPEWISALSDLTSTCLVFIGAALVWWQVRVSRRQSRWEKIADTIMHCNLRYDELYRVRVQLVSIKPSYNNIDTSSVQTIDANATDYKDNDSDIPDEVNLYYSRYWGLKSDQFDHWLAGLVDIETFSSWFWQTAASFHKDKEIRGISFLKGWERVGKPGNEKMNPWFTEFIDILKSLPQPNNSTTFQEFYLDTLNHLERETSHYRRTIQNGMDSRTFRDIIIGNPNNFPHDYVRLLERRDVTLNKRGWFSSVIDYIISRLQRLK